jgi:hypothetical protein
LHLLFEVAKHRSIVAEGKINSLLESIEKPNIQVQNTVYDDLRRYLCETKNFREFDSGFDKFLSLLQNVSLSVSVKSSIAGILLASNVNRISNQQLIQISNCLKDKSIEETIRKTLIVILCNLEPNDSQQMKTIIQLLLQSPRMGVGIERLCYLGGQIKNNEGLINQIVNEICNALTEDRWYVFYVNMDDQFISKINGQQIQAIIESFLQGKRAKSIDYETYLIFYGNFIWLLKRLSGRLSYDQVDKIGKLLLNNLTKNPNKQNNCEYLDCYIALKDYALGSRLDIKLSKEDMVNILTSGGIKITDVLKKMFDQEPKYILGIGRFCILLHDVHILNDNNLKRINPIYAEATAFLFQSLLQKKMPKYDIEQPLEKRILIAQNVFNNILAHETINEEEKNIVKDVYDNWHQAPQEICRLLTSFSNDNWNTESIITEKLDFDGNLTSFGNSKDAEAEEFLFHL